MHPVSDLKSDSSALGIRLIWYVVVTILINSDDELLEAERKNKVSDIMATKRCKNHVHLIHIFGIFRVL
jgi:hypothetical protein